MRSIILAAVAALLAPGALAQNVYVTADRLLDVTTGQMIQRPAVVIQRRRHHRRGPARLHAGPLGRRRWSTCPASPCCPA